MTTALIHQGPAYELNLNISPGEWGSHCLSFFSTEPISKHAKQQVRFKAFVSARTLDFLQTRIAHYLQHLRAAELRQADETASVCRQSEATIDQHVENFMKAWWSVSGGRAGTAYAWLLSAKARSLQDHLTAYLRKEGQLPARDFEFSYEFWGKRRAGVICADMIRRISEILLTKHSEEDFIHVNRDLRTPHEISLNISRTAYGFHLTFIPCASATTSLESRQRFHLHVSVEELKILQRTIANATGRDFIHCAEVQRNERRRDELHASSEFH